MKCVDKQSKFDAYESYYIEKEKNALNVDSGNIQSKLFSLVLLRFYCGLPMGQRKLKQWVVFSDGDDCCKSVRNTHSLVGSVFYIQFFVAKTLRL